MKRSVEMFSAVRDAILSNRYRGRIDGFITLHTYSQIWIHPYGHRRDTYPGDIQDLVSSTLFLENFRRCTSHNHS